MTHSRDSLKIRESPDPPVFKSDCLRNRKKQTILIPPHLRAAEKVPRRAPVVSELLLMSRWIRISQSPTGNRLLRTRHALDLRTVESSLASNGCRGGSAVFEAGVILTPRLPIHRNQQD